MLSGMCTLSTSFRFRWMPPSSVTARSAALLGSEAVRSENASFVAPSASLWPPLTSAASSSPRSA